MDNPTSNNQKEIDIFNSLINKSVNFNDWQNLVYQIQIGNIDINKVIKSVPKQMLCASYDDTILSEHNTFLNALVSAKLKGIEESLTPETLEYLVVNSDVKNHYTLDVYIRFIKYFVTNSWPPIVFPPSAVDYLLNNNKWALSEQPAFISKLDREIEEDYPAFIVMLQDMAEHYRTINEHNDLGGVKDNCFASLFSSEQISKMIRETKAKDMRRDLRGILYPLSNLNVLNPDLTDKQIEAIVKKLQFHDGSSMERALIEGLEFLFSPGRSGVNFLNLCDKIHGIDWAKAFVDKICKENTAPFISEKLSRPGLEAVIIDKNYGANPAVRKILANGLGGAVIAEYDIIMEKTKLENWVNGVESEINKGQKYKV